MVNQRCYAVMGENVGFWLTEVDRLGGLSSFFVTWDDGGILRARTFFTAQEAESYMDTVDQEKGKEYNGV